MKSTLLMAGATALLATSNLNAQEKPPYTAPPTAPPPAPAAAAAPGTLESFLNVKVPEVFAKGKFNINVRLRYEYADAQTLRSSHAPTIRTRFGYTTAPLYGLQGMIEAENITIIGNQDMYNQAGTNPGGAGKTIVADPDTTELNQAWISYSRYDSTVKGGRQRIVLDNHRFVGDVGWRQNQQTYDGVSFESKALKDFNFFYGYLWEVNRVFGDVPGLAAANRDFDADAHLFNVSYSGWKYGKIVAYSYLLAFENSAANSSQTWGLSFAGSYTFDKETNFKANYRAEYAHQADYRNHPFTYDADYYNLEGSADYKRFNVGGGYEVLGSDRGIKGFATPLATLHAFNGWADIFLATPATGLRDIYAFAGVKLPGEIPLKVIYHKFDADFGSGDFGYEWDIVASRAIGKHWMAMLKYAYFDGKAPFVDTQKLWAQVEFNF
ncbi:MAG: alginate export family protein [Verrucomicrobiota bacterium]